MPRLPRHFASWLVVPLLLVGTVGSFFLYERIQEGERPPPPVKPDQKVLAELDDADYTSKWLQRMDRQLRTLPEQQRSWTAFTLLGKAVEGNDVARVRQILPYVSRDDRQVGINYVTFAIRNGDLSTVRALLEGGVPLRRPQKRWPLQGKPGVPVELSSSDPEVAPLLEAASMRSVDAVRLLLARGARSDLRVRLTKGEVDRLAREGATPTSTSGPLDPLTLQPLRGAELRSAATAPEPVSQEYSQTRVITVRDLARLTGDRALIAAFDDEKAVKR